VRTAVAALSEAALAAIVAAGVAVVGLYAFSTVHWPAFSSSNELRALTTVGQVGALALLGWAVLLVRRRPDHRVGRLLSWAGLSGFVTVTLGLPLAATKLYLMGISSDQEFRTEYLTRLTDSARLHDMTYVDLPPFYPAGWFWIGGRVAHAAGMPGWEVFKPYSIGGLAVAAVVALVLWSKLIRPDLAIAAGVAVTAAVLAYGAQEPYSAPIIMLFVPALILAWGGLHRPAATTRGAGWAAIVGTGLFLGFAATFYTLYLAVAAATVTLMALFAAGLAVRAEHSWRAAVPVALRLVVAAGIAGVIALLVWTPFLLGLRTHHLAGSGTAFEFLPKSGAQLEFPMLYYSPLGWLCLIGTLWLVVRARSSRRAQSIGIGVIAIYLWSLGSMAVTLIGTTGLSFRLQPILVALLIAAGVFGFVEGAHAVIAALGEPARFRVAVLVLGAVGAVYFSQNIPHLLEPVIGTAYSDTDGNGERADQRPPSAVSYYRQLDRLITARRHRPQHDTVVLTGDYSFLSYYPYYGFQAHTSNYGNPMADFDARAATITQWAGLRSADQLDAALRRCRWRAPDVFVLRRAGDDYVLQLDESVYPNDPNVKRYPVVFPAKLFTGPHFDTTTVGPFVIVTRR
jgi:galactan 5-O-arabinofuranosyltransferase